MDVGSPFFYPGQGNNYAMLDPIVGVAILDQDFTAMTKAAAKTLVGWRTNIAPATIAAIKGAVLDGRNGVEPSGGENEITTTNVGWAVKTDVSLPILKFYAKMTWNDYQGYAAGQGIDLKFALFDAKKGLYGTNSSDTNYTPFSGHYELTTPMPKVGADRVKSYCFDIYFDDKTEWEVGNVEILRTDFSYMSLVRDLNPIGIDIKVITPITQTTGLVVVQANLRNSTIPYASLTTTSEWNVAAVSDAGVTLAVNSYANAAIGQYTLAILAGSSDITGPVVIRAYKITSGAITHLSNALTINKYTA
jgi:hypothetical protein